MRLLAVVTALATALLVAAGALVNAQGAALSVPDWPLSYGQVLLTHWPGNTAYEQFHRLMAAVSGVLVVALRVSMARDRTAIPVVRRLGNALGALFLLQVLMGGVVVLALAPPLVSALHVVLAQVIVAVAGVLAATLHGAHDLPASSPSPRWRRLTAALPFLVLTQIILGSLARHPTGQAMAVAALLAHLPLALVIVGLGLACGIHWARRGRGLVRGAAIVLAIGVLAQLAVGVVVAIVAPEPLVRDEPAPESFPPTHVAHVVLATVLLTASVILRRTLRSDRPAG